jgi:molybdopterin converting factor small subunit
MAPSPPKDHFKILYFAAASSFTSKPEEALPAPLPLSKLFDALETRYPGIRAHVLDSSLVTVNMTYVDVPAGDEDDDEEEVVIKEGDEVAIIPPVSSG